MRAARLAAPALLALSAGCSPDDDSAAPPVTADERRAVAEAREMIPDGELTATATATAAPMASEGARP